MRAEELLKPRFEVIADYPYNPHDIGAIIEARKNNSSIHQTTIAYTDEFGEKVNQMNLCMPKSFEKYPHLFRKLNWWEYRKVEDMPKKVTLLNDKEKTIYNIEEWDMELLVGWIDKKTRVCCSLTTFNPEYGYIPVD